MALWAINTLSGFSRTMRDGDVGLVGPAGMQYTAATPSVTMSGNSLLSVQGIVAYAGINVGMAAIKIDGAARISVQSSGTVTGPFEAISGTTVERVGIDNAGKIMGGTEAINLSVQSLRLFNSGEVLTTRIDGTAIRITTSQQSLIVNRGDIAGEAVGILAEGGGSLKLINSGTIVGGFFGVPGTGAVFATGQDDRIMNRGEIDGVVSLGGGNDRFDGEGGAAVFVSGGDGNDTVKGGAGDDTLNGVTGLDALFGRDGDDLMSGFSGQDTLWGGAGDDSLRGDDDADILVGQGGDDDIEGGLGNDTLNGGAGNDTLTGNNGADTFVFRGGHGHDVIVNFQNNIDKLDLKNFGLTAATLKSTFAKAAGSSVLIDLGDLGGGTIYVTGLSYANLDATDLIL